MAPIRHTCNAMQQTGLRVRLLLVLLLLLLLLRVIGCKDTVMYVLLRTGPCCADDDSTRIKLRYSQRASLSEVQ